MSEGITDYARMLVLIDDVKRLEREKNLIITCRDLEMKDLRAENARLKAEVERLTQNTDKLCKHGDLEIDRLKAEVERLRKAGDAMQKRLIFLHDRWDSDEPNIESDAWNAAKEGKQP
jgi:hypothetical protein